MKIIFSPANVMLTIIALALAFAPAASAGQTGPVSQAPSIPTGDVNALPGSFIPLSLADLPATPVHPAVAPGWSSLWLLPNPVNNTNNASVAVDSSGGVHVAFSAYSPAAGAWPVYYAHCSQDCGAAASWSIISLGNLGAFGGYPRLDLTPAGLPRIMWFEQTSVTADGVYRYATCNSNCTGSGWQIAGLYSNSLGPLYQSRYFALDAQGRPRFLYTDTRSTHTGTFYAYCNSGCSSFANWAEVNVSSSYLLSDLSLAFDAAGEARFGFYSSDTVFYAQCTGDCSQSASWSARALYALGTGGDLSFAVDSAGHPRLAFYEGSHSPAQATDNRLYYAWCDAANCTLSTAAWYNRNVGLPADYGYQPDLKLDSQDYPHLAYNIQDIATSTYGLGYGACTVNCQSSTPAWTHQVVETVDDLQQIDPIDPQPGCKSVWLDDGTNPSLALSGIAPQIAYGTAHYQGITCSIHKDITLVRFALGSGHLLKQAVWLPSLVR